MISCREYTGSQTLAGGHGGCQAAGQEISDNNEPAPFGQIVIPIAAGWLGWRTGLDSLSNLLMVLQIKHALRLEGSSDCVLHILLQSMLGCDITDSCNPVCCEAAGKQTTSCLQR